MTTTENFTRNLDYTRATPISYFEYTYQTNAGNSLFGVLTGESNGGDVCENMTKLYNEYILGVYGK